MKIVILDRNLAVLDYFSLLLKKFQVKLKIFSNKEKCLEYLNKNKDVDLIFVEEIFYKVFLDKFLNSFLIVLYFEAKDLHIENRLYYSVKKDILPVEFYAKFEIIKKLREYFLKEQKEKIGLTGVISYKEQQEEMATQKQLKLFLNELSMFYENDVMIETYYNPKDILSGDAIITKRIDTNRYFVAIIDAMGKGLSASLTASNSVGFLSYALSQALKHKDFNFSKIIESFVNYVKSILIENETLCISIGYIENNEFTFVNFGMPPIYVDRKKIKANNMPLSEWNKEIKIDKVEFKKDILMFSDGLIECWTKEEELYLRRLQKLLPNFVFLNDIIKDFKKHAIQSDDTTVIYLKKEKFKFREIYKEKLEISKQNINKFLKDFESIKVIKKEKIEFILQELLMNSYEHSSLQLRNLKDAILRDNKIELATKNSITANIIIYENDEFIKLDYSDNEEGFNLDIFKTLSRDKLHGRGIKMIKSISDGCFYNLKGNGVNIFIRKDK
jgi:hypothetical protein